MDDVQAQAMNAWLVLVLANHIGDRQVPPRRSGWPRDPTKPRRRQGVGGRARLSTQTVPLRVPSHCRGTVFLSYRENKL